MSEYIVELDSKHSVALRLAFFEEMRGGDFVRGEIVRCRDCAYYDKYTNDEIKVCYRFDNDQPIVEPDDFCSWGERKVER